MNEKSIMAGTLMVGLKDKRIKEDLGKSHR